LCSRLLYRNAKVQIHKTIILPVVLYGCETWSLILKVEHRLRLCENRVLRIFGFKWAAGIGKWRNLHNEELHNLYPSSNIIKQIKSRRMRWARHVALMEEERKVYKVLVGNPEGNNHSEDHGVDGRMGSEWILRRLGGGCGLDSIGSL
jgi:hypothetical protein